MSLWEKITSVFRPKRKSAYGPSLWQPLGGAASGYYDAFGGQHDPSKTDLANAYQDVVFACVRLIADATIRAQIKLFAKTEPGQAKPRCATAPVGRKSLLQLRQKHLTHGVDVKEVTAHPLLDLLRHCNSYHSYSDLLGHTQTSIDLIGEAFWLMEYNALGIPCEIYLLPAQNVEPIRDDKEIVKGWKFREGVTEKDYSKDEVIQFRARNPQDPYAEGYSPTRAAWSRIQIAWKELAFLDNTLSNQGRPDAILAPNEPVSPFEAERLAKEFRHRFQGQGNGGVFIADGPMTLTPISWPVKDLAELQLFQAVKTITCNVFGVPPDIFELGESNRATAEAALYALAVHCIQPRVDYLVEQLNHRLVPYFDKRLFFAAESVVPEDRQFELQLVQTLGAAGALTRNEIRREFGFEPTQWGDEPLLPSGMMPAQAFADQPGEVQAEPSDQPDEAVSQQVLALQSAVYAGQLPREAAIANARYLLGLPPEEAAALFPPKPEGQAPPVPEQPGSKVYKAETRKHGDKCECEKCGGEGGKPGPCPEEEGNDQPAASPHHQAAKQKISDAIAKADHLTPEQKQYYEQAAHAVIGKMTPKAAERFASNVKGYNFHNDTKSLTEHLATKNPKVQKMLEEGKRVGGAYSPGSGVLNLDGDNVLEGKPMKAPGVYAHEFGHAIDLSKDPASRISSTPEWKDAWDSEIRSGKISKYSTGNEVEGFAEFSRLVHATKLTTDQIAQHFPKSVDVWRKHGLI